MVITIMVIVIIFMMIGNIYSFKENFTDNICKFCVDKYNYYNNEIYPLKEKITKEENELIVTWLNKLTYEDISIDKHISSYTIGYTIHKNGYVNKSRLGIGTKTKFNMFKKDVLNLFKKFNIYNILPVNYNYAGIAWDIEDKIIKIYGLSSDNSEIICYVFNCVRNGKKIKSLEFQSIKKYSVGEEKTIMYKNNNRIAQHNIYNKLPEKYYKLYPESKKIVAKMTNDKWHLDTYSEYDNKLNLYFY